MQTTENTSTHYSAPGLRDRFESIVAGLTSTDQPVRASDLSALDHFHVGGVSATKRLAAHLSLTADSRVLDLGSGLGGPARFLNEAFGCPVWGVDITPDYVEIANRLTEITQQKDVVFQVGSALETRLPNEFFDAAMALHVGMNIQEKSDLVTEVKRVLAPGGLFAIYEIVSDEPQDQSYPMPWAATQEDSFLASADELVSLLKAQDFEVVRVIDDSDWAITALSNARRLREVEPKSPLPTLDFLLGPASENAFANLSLALALRKLSVVTILAKRNEQQTGAGK